MARPYSPFQPVGKLKLAGRRIVFETIIFFFKQLVGSLE
jgi:hypothetical protein